MSQTPTWVFFGRSDSTMNRIYDWLRRRVNTRLVRFLIVHLRPACDSPDAEVPTESEPVFVLEAGSGTAYASSLLACSPHVDAAVCLDIDETALRQAKRRDSNLPAVVADLTNMPFREGVFSLVFNSSTVEHLPEPAAAVREMHRVCRHGGSVFVGVPYRYGPLAFQRLIARTRLGQWLGPVFSRRSLERMLQAEGLTPVRHICYFLRFFVGSVGIKPSYSAAPPV